MKKQLSLAMAGVMALSLAACGGSSASSAATSTAEAASSTAESTAESTAAEGDVLDQAAAAAFAQDVTLTMWGAEEDQDLLREISDKFIEKYGNYGGKDHHQSGISVRVHGQGYRPDRPHRRC